MSSRRTIGFSSENPIATSDIIAYLQLYDIDNKELFMRLMAEMDSEYLDVRYSKTGKSESKVTQKPETMTGNKF